MTYISPRGRVWLLLGEERGKARCLELSTGDVMTMTRPIADLCKLGWREWSPEREERAKDAAYDRAAWAEEIAAAKKRMGL